MGADNSAKKEDVLHSSYFLNHTIFEQYFHTAQFFVKIVAFFDGNIALYCTL